MSFRRFRHLYEMKFVQIIVIIIPSPNDSTEDCIKIIIYVSMVLHSYMLRNVLNLSLTLVNREHEYTILRSFVPIVISHYYRCVRSPILKNCHQCYFACFPYKSKFAYFGFPITLFDQCENLFVPSNPHT